MPLLVFVEDPLDGRLTSLTHLAISGVHPRAPGAREDASPPVTQRLVPMVRDGPSWRTPDSWCC